MIDVQELKAIHAGEVDVQQDQVRSVVFKVDQGILGIVKDSGVHPFPL